MLSPEARHFCRSLIYPTPIPELPFLGVHLTRRINGDVECGPNAVLSFAREGYQKSHVSLRDMFETFSFRGFYKMSKQHWRYGVGEQWRSISKKAFVRALKKLIPEIREEHLLPGGSGVRAQAVDADGKLVSDFFFRDTARSTHVLNAPSPAATAAMAIGQLVARRAMEKLN